MLGIRHSNATGDTAKMGWDVPTGGRVTNPPAEVVPEGGMAPFRNGVPVYYAYQNGQRYYEDREIEYTFDQFFPSNAAMFRGVDALVDFLAKASGGTIYDDVQGCAFTNCRPSGGIEVDYDSTGRYASVTAKWKCDPFKVVHGERRL